MFVRTKNELLGTHSFSLGFHHETDGLSMKTSPDGSKLVQNWCMMLEGASHLVNVFTPSYMEYPHSNIIYMGLYVIYIYDYKRFKPLTEWDAHPSDQAVICLATGMNGLNYYF